MLIAGHLILPAEPGSIRLERGWLRLAGDRIADLGVGKPPATPDLGGDGHIISPGLVDTHLHIPQFDSIGADGLPLLRWLEQVIFPAEARWADADFAAAMAQRVARRLLAAGTTAIAAYATVHAAGAAAAMRELARAGLAGCVGQVLMDRPPYAPPALCRPTADLLAEAAAAAPVGRLQPAITPRFAVCCTAELLAGCGELAARTGRVIQTHLSETLDECELIRRLYDGASYVEVYRRAGLLTPRTLLGHGIWLNDADRETLSRTGAIIAHCPTANLFLQAGLMDLPAHTRAAVRISLGSDVAGGPDVCMLRVARAMIESVKRLRMPPPAGAGLTDRRLISPAAAWWQITTGNAQALGLEAGHGELRGGAPADLVILRPRDDAWQTAADPIGALLYGFDERWIEHTIANGAVA